MKKLAFLVVAMLLSSIAFAQTTDAVKPTPARIEIAATAGKDVIKNDVAVDKKEIAADIAKLASAISYAKKDWARVAIDKEKHNKTKLKVDKYDALVAAATARVEARKLKNAVIDLKKDVILLKKKYHKK